jgi:hypothetical protein
MRWDGRTSAWACPSWCLRCRIPHRRAGTVQELLGKLRDLPGLRLIACGPCPFKRVRKNCGRLG